METLKKFFSEPKISFGVFFLFIILVGAVVWFGVSKGNEIKLSNLSSPHYMGEDVVTPDISLKVESIREDLVGQAPLTPQPGDKFVVATVSLTNNTNKPFDFIPLLYFYLKDKDGNVYHVAGVPSDKNQMSGPILPYDKIREEIGFEVAKSTTDLKLYFETGLPNNNVISIALTNPK